MNIILNGETKDVTNNITLLEVIKKYNLEGKVMAAAVNMEVVKQDSWGECSLKEGDKVELLDFVGGG